MLSSHPNQPFVKSVCEGLREGFWPWADTQKDGYPDSHREDIGPPLDSDKAAFLRASLRRYIYISIWDTTQVTSYIHMGTYPPAKFFEKQGAAGVPGLVRMTNRVLWVGG